MTGAIERGTVVGYIEEPQQRSCGLVGPADIVQGAVASTMGALIGARCPQTIEGRSA
jgi:hypothetical protein